MVCAMLYSSILVIAEEVNFQCIWIYSREYLYSAFPGYFDFGGLPLEWLRFSLFDFFLNIQLFKCPPEVVAKGKFNPQGK